MDRRSVVFVDLESVRAPLEDAGVSPLQFAARAAAWGRAQGRLVQASFYGHLTAEDLRELRGLGCEGHLTVEEGEGSAPESIALAVDAAESLALGAPPDVVLLVTDDSQLVELVRRWRRRGALVAVAVPGALLSHEPARSADRSMDLSEILSGDMPAPLPARPREPRVRPALPAAPFNLETFDWSLLVSLLRELEARMPFVGMRWLKNKVLGPHNVGVSSMADKQALLNRAVDLGMVETYRVGNRAEAGDPVTACRLVRMHPAVAPLVEGFPGPNSQSGASEAAADDGADEVDVVDMAAEG